MSHASLVVLVVYRWWFFAIVQVVIPPKVTDAVDREVARQAAEHAESCRQQSLATLSVFTPSQLPVFALPPATVQGRQCQVRMGHQGVAQCHTGRS